VLTLESVSTAWQILHRAGVPIASAERVGPAPDTTAVAAALCEVMTQPPRGREAEALAAFIFAWRSEFPTSFAAGLRGRADQMVAWAQEQLRDDNRYLKLRRIAIAHLAEVF
jgi:hypothetical protein